jgi:pimeloyl-ACP methyl ester carboxylesterase
MSLFAEGLYSLLQHLETGPVILAGHSMGGYVALAFAKAFPQMLRSLVLVGTKAGADTQEGAAARRATAEKVRVDGVSVVVDAMAPKMLSATNTDAAMGSAVRGFMALSKPEGVIGALLGMAERPDAGAWLGAIRVPTLVITGADDTIIPPSESEALAKAIPGAQLKLIPNAGHLVAFEQADAFNSALRAWLG